MDFLTFLQSTSVNDFRSITYDQDLDLRPLWRSDIMIQSTRTVMSYINWNSEFGTPPRNDFIASHLKPDLNLTQFFFPNMDVSSEARLAVMSHS